MRKFDWQKALEGEPVMLRNGRKAYIKFRVPTPRLDKTAFCGYYIDYSTNVAMSWDEEGGSTVSKETDIIGMFDYPNVKINGIPVMPPVYPSNFDITKKYFIVDFSRDDNVRQAYLSDKKECENLLYKGLVFDNYEAAVCMATALLSFKKENDWGCPR